MCKEKCWFFIFCLEVDKKGWYIKRNGSRWYMWGFFWFGWVMGYYNWWYYFFVSKWVDREGDWVWKFVGEYYVVLSDWFV